jgi:hypothetical protein
LQQQQLSSRDTHSTHASSTRLYALPEPSPGRLVEYGTQTASPSPALLGAVVGPDGKRNLKILTSSGRITSVPPRAIKHVVPNGRSITTALQIAEHERAAAAALAHDGETGGAAVVEVWEMLLLDQQNQDNDDSRVELTTLADLLVGDDTSLSCHAARTVLTHGAERFCFKEVNHNPREKKRGEDDSSVVVMYEPRPVPLVETMRARARVEAEEGARWTQLKHRIDEACRSTSSSSSHAVYDTFALEDESEEVVAAFRALERLGCLANLSPEDADREEKAAAAMVPGTAPTDGQAMAEAKTFLKQLGRRSTPEAARTLLVGTGRWDVHTNLDLIRLRTPTAFSDSLEELAAGVVSDPPMDVDESSRLDLTHLSALAIDEASTREIDDALSVERITNTEETGGEGPLHARQRLWIHIADPTRYIPLGSPLANEARRRASSLYLPTGAVPMFPMVLASGPLCLSPGRVSCALSVGIMLDADGAIDQTTPPVIAPSLVRTTRLTYEEVDRILDPFARVADDDDDDDDHGDNNDDNGSPRYDQDENTVGDPELTECLRRLQWASEQRLQWRKDGGSLESIGPYEMPDMSVKAWPSPDEPDGWGVAIGARERYAASRIVTELMLLANEAIATYGDANGIAMPFRSQETTEISDLELAGTPDGPCRSWLAIRSTRRSQIMSTPQPHDGLGLDYYVQCTSPVRRYADLALHYQLKAHLRGDELPFSANDDTDADIVRLAQDGGKAASRLLERSANDYWLREFLRRRGAEPTSVLVLSGDSWKPNLYKILLPKLGAIMTYRSSRPLDIGAQLDVSSITLSEFV